MSTRLEKAALKSRLQNWKFDSAVEVLNANPSLVAIEDAVAIRALAQLVGNSGWFDGHLATVISVAVDALMTAVDKYVPQPTTLNVVVAQFIQSLQDGSYPSRYLEELGQLLNQMIADLTEWEARVNDVFILVDDPLGRHITNPTNHNTLAELVVAAASREAMGTSATFWVYHCHDMQPLGQYQLAAVAGYINVEL